MLLGFNTNYRYRGVLFHVQTEDSGLDNPHVITHLFHGGNIMVSRKGDYSALLGSSDIETDVRNLMESQHKTMLQGLQAGEFDDVIVQRVGPTVFRDTDTDTMSQLGFAERSPAPAVDAPPPPPEPVAPARPAPPPAATAPTGDRLDRAFGEGVVSEKPLDEVVLEYLVENARKRKRRSR